MNFNSLLEKESFIFSKYLIGKNPTKELIQRYIQGNEVLFGNEPLRGENSTLNFCRNHPWSVPLLDGAAGLLSKNHLLRKKILLMSAVLETSPVFADDFLSKPVTWVAFFSESLFCGIGTAISLFFGIPLFLILGGTKK